MASYQEPESQHHPPLHIGAVILIALGYWIVLRILTSGLWMLLWANHQRVDDVMGRWGAVIPWPWLVLLFPIIVFILLALFAKGDDGQMLPRRQAPTPVIQSQGAGPSWLHQYYTRQQLMTLLKWVTVVWLVIVMTQLIFWFGFSSYRQ